jgi:hypothetical protein
MKASEPFDTDVQVQKRIVNSHNGWLFGGRALQIVMIVLGVVAVGSSILVTAVSLDKSFTWLPLNYIAASATFCLTLFNFFHLQRQQENFMEGWKFLNASLVLYYAKKTSIEELVEDYRVAERMVGVMKVSTETVSSRNPEDSANTNKTKVKRQK